jgi:hypothetical protein
VLPNFFVVGAPKAGTTALYHYLGQHPAVYMSPIKEPAFFATDLFEHRKRLGKIADTDALRAYLDGPMTERRSGVIDDWNLYLKLFKNVRHETAVGEVSGNYLASAAAPREICDRIPRARIIMMLRDPVDRLYSQYSQAVSRGDARPGFLRWVEEQQTAEATYQPKLGAVWNGFYARHLRRYLDHFPKQQVRTYFYEDYRRSPREVLRDLFAFLSVDADFSPDMSLEHNVTWQPRSVRLQKASAPLRRVLRKFLPPGVGLLRWTTHKRPERLTDSERAAVLPIYEEDIQQLQSMLGRDLSAWLNSGVR